MTSEEIDTEVLKQANELLRFLKSQKLQGEVPTPESTVTINVANIKYRLVATEETLNAFIQKYKWKDSIPRSRKLPGGGSIPIEMKKLPRFNKNNFNAWELCETEDRQSAETLGGLF